jgi:quercetin dioxygenase-like cupin family protein
MLRLVLALLAGLALRPAAGASRVEIENDWVRVLRVRQEPHERTALLQQHPPTVMVYLTDANQNITGADGTAHAIRHKAGETAYLEAGRRAEENLLDRPFEAVLIELKPVKLNAAPVALDPVKLDPKNHIVDFENDRVRVLRTILEPHIKSPMHEHPAYVVVYLTDLHTTMKLADGREVDNPRKPGEIAWRDALKHQTENIGERTAMEIQVELK